MALMIQFFRADDTDKRNPVPLAEVDNTICQALGKPIHPVRWYLNWFNLLGFGLASGEDYVKLAKHYEDDPELLEVLAVLREKFTYYTWCGR